MPDMQILGPLIGVGLVILFILVGIAVAKSMKGGAFMTKINAQYAALAATLGLPPPVAGQGYPVLTIDSGNGLAITIRPVTHYHRENASGFSNIPAILLESPYDGLDDVARARAAASSQVAGTLLSMAGRGSSYTARACRTKAEQLTEITLALPLRFRDTKILLTPETAIGSLTNMGEIGIDDRDFDREFKIKGVDVE